MLQISGYCKYDHNKHGLADVSRLGYGDMEVVLLDHLIYPELPFE